MKIISRKFLSLQLFLSLIILHTTCATVIEMLIKLRHTKEVDAFKAASPRLSGKLFVRPGPQTAKRQSPATSILNKKSSSYLLDLLTEERYLNEFCQNQWKTYKLKSTKKLNSKFFSFNGLYETFHVINGKLIKLTRVAPISNNFQYFTIDAYDLTTGGESRTTFNFSKKDDEFVHRIITEEDKRDRTSVV